MVKSLIFTPIKAGLKKGAKKNFKVVSKKTGPKIVSKKGTKTLGKKGALKGRIKELRTASAAQAGRKGLNRAKTPAGKRIADKVGDANQKKIIAGGALAGAVAASRDFGRTKPKTKESKTTVADSQKNTSIKKNLNVDNRGFLKNQDKKVNADSGGVRTGFKDEAAKKKFFEERQNKMGGGMMKKRMKRGGTAKKKRAKRMGGGMMKKRMKRGGRA